MRTCGFLIFLLLFAATSAAGQQAGPADRRVVADAMWETVREAIGLELLLDEALGATVADLEHRCPLALERHQEQVLALLAASRQEAVTFVDSRFPALLAERLEDDELGQLALWLNGTEFEELDPAIRRAVGDKIGDISTSVWADGVRTIDRRLLTSLAEVDPCFSKPASPGLQGQHLQPRISALAGLFHRRHAAVSDVDVK